MRVDIENLVRKNIKGMTPYSSARHEFSGHANIYLDANENSFGSPLSKYYNRYPDPLQIKLKEKISLLKSVPGQNIFLGSGSDEAIDLLLRIFCEPGRDNVIICPPTYGMYEVCAAINDVEVKKVSLTTEFYLNIQDILKAVDPFTKIIFTCSPNNPTGNSMPGEDIEKLLNNFSALVVIDEAYIDYSTEESFSKKLQQFPNLVVLQTFSKAWGLAGLRLGMAFAGEPVIGWLNKVKYPYNISTATQQLVLKALDKVETVNEWINITIEQREELSRKMAQLPVTRKVYPSDANFILVKMERARDIYEFLLTKDIIVRDRSKVLLCDDCLRITIGTPGENKQLMQELNSYK